MQEFLHITGRQVTGKMCHLHYPGEKAIVISQNGLLREGGRQGEREGALASPGLSENPYLTLLGASLPHFFSYSP